MTGNTRILRNVGWLIAAVALLFYPAQASAHLVSTGMGPVYDGIGHLLLTPEDLVPVLALALYAGLRGPVAGKTNMFLLPLAWFVGGLVGSTSNIVPPAVMPAVSFLIFGILIASDLCLPAAAVTALAVALGVAHGFVNGAVLRDGAGALGLLGTMVMLFVLSALASALVVSLKKPWMRITVRVAGSWIAAIGFLMLGWALR